VIAKGGSKMKEFEPPGNPQTKGLRLTGRGHIEAQGISLDFVSHVLSQPVSVVVIDHIEGPSPN
jgi:hypothetical protein